MERVEIMATKVDRTEKRDNNKAVLMMRSIYCFNYYKFHNYKFIKSFLALKTTALAIVIIPVIVFEISYLFANRQNRLELLY